MAFVMAPQNRISTTGCVAIAAALKTNTSVRSLCLAMNTINAPEPVSVMDESNILYTDSQLLSQLMKRVDHQQQLGTQALADMLAVNRTLQCLCMSQAGVDWQHGLAAMAAALRTNATLTRLKYDVGISPPYTNLDDEPCVGLVALSATMQGNESLARFECWLPYSGVSEANRALIKQVASKCQVSVVWPDLILFFILHRFDLTMIIITIIHKLEDDTITHSSYTRAAL